MHTSVMPAPQSGASTPMQRNAEARVIDVKNRTTTMRFALSANACSLRRDAGRPEVGAVRVALA